MNSQLCETFQHLISDISKEIKETGNKTLNFKIATYRKLIKILCSLDFKVTDSSQLKDFKGVGTSSLKKIDEILKSGTLKIIKNTDSSKTKDFFDLQRITGIGSVKADKLLSKGITLSKLLKINFNTPSEEDNILLKELTHHQKLGVKYFHDIESKIPYEEIQKIESFLKEIIKSLSEDLDIIICGSYRRKKPTSGDIDVIVYSNKLKTIEKTKSSDHLTTFLQFLADNNFLVDNLTSFDNPTKYMGFCKLDGVSPFSRRIDIRLIPYNSLPAAMLYFTGSGDFNRNMRAFANKANYTINEYGMYIMKDRKKKFKLKISSEKDIFHTLGLPYIKPEDRVPEYKF